MPSTDREKVVRRAYFLPTVLRRPPDEAMKQALREHGYTSLREVQKPTVH